MIAFRPGPTLTLTATGSSSGGTVSGSATQLEIQNEGGETVFVRWGVGAQTATTADYPVMPGQSKSVTCGQGTTHVAAITGGGTCRVFVTSGEGV